ncbi:MAG: hypothetical protein ACRC1P_11425 [Cellulosilyticaceae bacterium]
MANLDRIKTLVGIMDGRIGKPAEFAEFNDTDIKGQYQAEINKIFSEGKNWYRTFRKHKNDLFQIIEESIDEDLPNEVIQAVGIVADVQTVQPGDTKQFKVKKNKNGIRKTVVEVAFGGRLKRYKLDKNYLDIKMNRFGTAVSIEKEELRYKFLDFAEFKAEAQQGVQDAIYRKIHEVLKAVTASLPATNSAAASGFDEDLFDELIAKAKSYGDTVKIVCTERFAQKIPFPANDQLSMSEIRTNGYVRMYKGCQVQIIPNAITGVHSDDWTFGNQTAYIIPTNKDEKFISVLLEGSTEIEEFKDADTDEEVFEVTANFGVACVIDPVYLYKYTNQAI